MKKHLDHLWLLLFAAALISWVMVTEPLTRAFFNLKPLAFALVFVLAFCGIGSVVVRLFSKSLNVIDNVLYSLAIGLGLTGLFVFIPGLFGSVDPRLYALWTISGLVMCGWALLRWWRFSPPKLRITHPLSILAAIVIVCNILQLLPYVSAPVFSTDELEYHLLIPKIHLLEGKIGLIPSLVESNYPCLAEFIYMPVLALANDITCKALHLWIGIAALIAIARLSRRIYPEGNVWIAPALFLSMPVTIVAWGLAWNDAIFVLFLLLALGLLADYHEMQDKKLAPMILAGILVGLAAWTKYTIVMILLALIPLFILGLVRWRFKLSHVIGFAIPVGLISLLVFAKNWAYTSNPFYPFLHSMFPSPYWNDNAAAYFSYALRGWEISDWGLTTYLSFPLHITMRPRLIDTQTGILLLVFIPFLFLSSANRQMNLLRAFVGFNTIAWLILHTENRSLFTMIAILFAVGVAGFERSIWQKPSLRRPAIILLALGFLANGAVSIINTHYMTEPVSFFFGLESRTDFLLREAESHATYNWLNKNDEVEAVLLVSLKRPYHLNRPAYFSAFADPPIAEIITRGATTAEEVRQRLTAYGISHVSISAKWYEYDHKHELYSWPDEQRRAFETFITKHCKPVFAAGKEVTYRIATD